MPNSLNFFRELKMSLKLQRIESEIVKCRDCLANAGNVSGFTEANNRLEGFRKASGLVFRDMERERRFALSAPQMREHQEVKVAIDVLDNILRDLETAWQPIFEKYWEELHAREIKKAEKAVTRNIQRPPSSYDSEDFYESKRPASAPKRLLVQVRKAGTEGKLGVMDVDSGALIVPIKYGLVYSNSGGNLFLVMFSGSFDKYDVFDSDTGLHIFGDNKEYDSFNEFWSRVKSFFSADVVKSLIDPTMEEFYDFDNCCSKRG